MANTANTAGYGGGSANTGWVPPGPESYTWPPESACDVGDIDDEAAAEFLRLLDPSVDNFTFLSLDDRRAGRKELVRELHGSFSDKAQELAELNQQGAGVFVTVHRTDGKGRKSGNITGVRALAGDFDNGLPKNFPLEPSLVVQTSPGRYQAHWFVDDLTFDEVDDAVRRLVRDYGSDKNAADRARVFRIPGFYHKKREPFLVRMVGGNGRRYTSVEIMAAFPPCEAAGAKVWQGQREPFDRARVEAALKCILADEYEIWIRIGMALHHATEGSREGLAIYDTWSKTSAKYDAREVARKWKSFSSSEEDPVTLNTLFATARERGWSDDGASASASAKGAKPIDWPKVDERGRPLPRSQGNIRAFLRHLNLRLFKDQFAGTYHIEGLEKQPVELDDAVVRELYMKADELGLKTSKEYFCDALLVHASADGRHPVRDYLDSLEWDGEERLEKWLQCYAGAEDTEFVRAAGWAFMIAAVRRVRQPGCKFDNLPVLGGAQGVGKSSLARILAGDVWFSDGLSIGEDSKLVIEKTKGKWILELSELAGLGKRDVESVKSMLSRQTDIARLAYARTTSTVPRQFVLIGTTNSAEYLLDSTGNRRFWPIQVGKVDLQALRRDRDQLWAEAAYWEARGESHDLPEELWAAAREQQEKRRSVDPLEEQLEVVVGEERAGVIPIDELYAVMGVGGHERIAQRTRRHSEIISRVMMKLGWKQGRRRVKAKFPSADKNANLDNRQKVFVKGDDSVRWRFDEYKGCMVSDQ